MLHIAYRKKNQDIYSFNLPPKKYFTYFIIILIVLENLCIFYHNRKSHILVLEKSCSCIKSLMNIILKHLESWNVIVMKLIDTGRRRREPANT